MRPRYKVSRTGLELIKGFEGLRRRAARLPDGRWIIGHGHTLSAREGAEVSEADAEALLLFDLLPVVAALNNLLEREVAQHQFDALASFAFSVGVEAFAGSTVLKRVNEGRFAEAALAIEVWRNTRFEGRSVTLEALVRRRAAEAALLLGEPVSTPTPRELLRPEEDAAAAAALPTRPPARAEIDMEGDAARVRLYEELARDSAPSAPEPAAVAAPEPAAPAEPVGFTAAQAEAVAQLLAEPEPEPEPEPTPEVIPEPAPEVMAAPAAESEAAPAPEPEPVPAEPASAPAPSADAVPPGSPPGTVTLASAALTLRLHAPYGASATGAPLPAAPAEPAPVPPAVPETTESATAAEPTPEPEPDAGLTISAEAEAPPQVLVLTPPPEIETTPPSVAEAADAEADAAPEVDPAQVPLFGPLPDREPPRILVHDETPEPPSPPKGRWSDTGAFVAMGAVGLAALGSAIAAFQLAAEVSPPAGEFDEKTGIAWALAVIGSILVGLAAYHLFKRIGGVDD